MLNHPDMQSETKKPFDALYRQYHDPIVRYLAKMTSAQEAEDLAQEVFAKVSGSLDRFEGRAKISTWIYRIATNTALDRLRNPRRRRIEIPLMETFNSSQLPGGPSPSAPSGPLAQVIDSEMNDCIRQQVDKLPNKYRTVMILNGLEEFKNREIADILEISLEAVKMRLHRGRAMLKEILEKECRFYHDADTGALQCDRKEPESS